MTRDRSIEALKATLRVLENLERDLPKVAPTLPISTQVEIGHVISGLARHAGRALDKLKLSLRVTARGLLAERYGTLVLKGPDRERCLVHFPRPEVRLRKEADIAALRAYLGDMFPVFFETSYVPTRDFEEHLAELPDPKPLLDAVDIPEATPRVKFEIE